MPTYRENSYWRAYQRFFPPDLRCEGPSEPQEEHWPWRGLQVHLDRYPAPDAPLKLIAVHGAGGYGRFFSATGLAARAGDAEVIAPDLPGYGLSAAPDGFTVDDWVDCLSDLIQHERRRDPRPIVLFGGSMGSMVAYAAAARGDVAGLITTLLLDPRRPEVVRAVARFPGLGAVAPAFLGATPSLFGKFRVPVRWMIRMQAMSRQAELSRLVAADPQGGGVSVPVEFLKSFVAWKPAVEFEDFKSCPVLVAHPGHDDWTPAELSRPFFDKLTCPKQFVLLEEAGHLPVEEPGLSQLRAALLAFLADRKLELS